MRPWIVALLLAGCAEAPQPPSGPLASTTVATTAAPSAESTTPRLLARRARPEELRARDETACTGGDVAACRKMADRFRGYGAPAGCGVDRGRARPFIKRVTGDSDEDDRQFIRWAGKACDLGDEEACRLEGYARAGHDDSTSGLEQPRLRSAVAGSAVIAWQKAAEPAVHAGILERRKGCLGGEDAIDGCWNIGAALYQRTSSIDAKKPPQKLLAAAETICAETLECDDVSWMLDRNGVSLEARAPLFATAEKVLVEACLDGACVCGQALGFVKADDPRRGELAELACENGEAEGCYELGRVHEARGDLARATALYDLACPPEHPTWEGRRAPRMGELSPHACDRLAELHERGVMPPKEEPQAWYYAKLACQNPGVERDHAPCVRVARYWATTGRTTGRKTEDMLRYFDEKECKRPSVAAVCQAHRKEVMSVKD
jgi:hypothetical protein